MNSDDLISLQDVHSLLDEDEKIKETHYMLQFTAPSLTSLAHTTPVLKGLTASTSMCVAKCDVEGDSLIPRLPDLFNVCMRKEGEPGKRSAS